MPILQRAATSSTCHLSSIESANALERHTLTRPLLLLLVAAFGILFAGTGVTPPAQAQDAPVPDDAMVEKIAGDFQFTEGPYWHADGYLVFSDIPANTIYRWAPGKEATVFLKPSGHSNGITADEQGRLLLAQHDGRIARVEDGEATPLVTEYDGKRLNSPNDLVVRSDGSIYFTDPPYGVDEENRELDFSGVYRLHSSGELELLTKAFSRPNGICFSPDESKLYVNDSGETLVHVFDVAEDGSIANGRVFARPEDANAQGSTDGMKVDTAGNVYTTGPGGIWIYAPDGTLLDRISVPHPPTNLAFGGPDNTTLYITARPDVYRIQVNIPGVK